MPPQPAVIESPRPHEASGPSQPGSGPRPPRAIFRRPSSGLSLNSGGDSSPRQVPGNRRWPGWQQRGVAGQQASAAPAGRPGSGGGGGGSGAGGGGEGNDGAGGTPRSGQPAVQQFTRGWSLGSGGGGAPGGTGTFRPAFVQAAASGFRTPRMLPRKFSHAVTQTDSSMIKGNVVDAGVQTTATMHGVEENGYIRIGEPVTLHIYDVTVSENVQLVNGLLRNVGTGAFHAAVEVFGWEWSFGFTEDGGTGVHSVVPRGNTLHQYREEIHMGTTPYTEPEVDDILVHLSYLWMSDDYDVLSKNCCHFSDTFCQMLTGQSVPRWVMNLAGAGAKLRIGMDAAVSGAQAAADAVAAFDVFANPAPIEDYADKVMQEIDKPRNVVPSQGVFANAARQVFSVAGALQDGILSQMPSSEMPRSMIANGPEIGVIYELGPETNIVHKEHGVTFVTV